MKNYNLLCGALIILMGACKGTTTGNVDSPESGGPGSGGSTGKTGVMLFSLQDARGIAIKPVVDGSSNLIKLVPSSGDPAVYEARETLISGSANVSRMKFVSGKLYLFFDSGSDVDGSVCYLAEVNRQTGVPTCVSDSVVQGGVQFDDSGAAYFASGDKLIKYYNGSRTDKINGFLSVSAYIVLGDGGVLYSKNNTTKYVSAANSLTNLSTDYPALSFVKFPDGNIYFDMGMSGSNIYRFITGTNSIDPNMYIRTDGSGGGTTETYNAYGTIQSPGQYLKNAVSTVSGKVYFSGFAPSNSPDTLIRLFPGQPSRVTTVLEKTNVLAAVLDSLLIAGTDSSDNNRLMMMNTADESEVNLLPSHNIEIYQIRYSATDNKVFFHGLNFADNKVVIGSVDLVSRSVELLPVGNGEGEKLLDIFRILKMLRS